MPKSDEPETDLDLAISAEAGDIAAVAQLYARHHGTAFHTARRVVDHNEAEDVAASVFIDLLEGRWKPTPHATPTHGGLGAFIRTISHRRALAARVGRPMVDQWTLDDSGPTIARLHATSKYNPESCTLRRELRQRVLQGIMALPPALRAVAVLRYFRELSVPDIEERLGLARGSGFTYLYRIRKQLRVTLADVVDDIPPAGRVGRRRERFERVRSE